MTEVHDPHFSQEHPSIQVALVSEVGRKLRGQRVTGPHGAPHVFAPEDSPRDQGQSPSSRSGASSEA